MAVYTHGQHEAVTNSYSWRSVANSASYLAPHLQPGLAVLDVGCGPGSITRDLAERVAPGVVTALDQSEEALAKARATVGDLSTVVFTVGDVHALDFADDQFDIVHAHQVLQHVADPVAALREMRRVAKPGGIVAARDADYEAMTWFPASPGIADWLALYRAVARANGGQPDAGRQLKAWARAAGFTDIICSASTWTYATAAERRWWSTVWQDRLTVTAFAEQAQRDGYATAGDIDRMLEGWRTWTADDDGWFVIVHGEILCRA